MIRILLLALLAAGALTLAACGSDQAPATKATLASSTPQAAAATPSAAPAAPTGPRQFKHELGTTTVPGVPKRIVVLEYSFADNLGQLGIVPVGYAVDAPPAYIAKYTKDAGSVAVGTRAEPNLEAIVGLKPDLILGDLNRHEKIYAKLSAIAPTLIFNSLRGSYQDQLDTFGMIADTVGKKSEAAEFLKAHQAAYAAAAKTAKADSPAILVGVVSGNTFTAHTKESFMGSFLEGLGRKNTLKPRSGETQFTLGLEGMASVNPGTIVILCDPSAQEAVDDLAASPVWRSFEAVKNNRVYMFDQNLWSKGRGLIAYELTLKDAIESGLLTNAPSTRTSCR